MKKFMGFISAILLFSSCMFQNATNDELKRINIQLMKPANIDVARVECVV